MEPATNANSKTRVCVISPKAPEATKAPVGGQDATAVPECPANCTVKSSEEEKKHFDSEIKWLKRKGDHKYKKKLCHCNAERPPHPKYTAT